MAKKPSPVGLTLFVYQVGFGDCFLLQFQYPAPHPTRHVLVDLGSTASPKNAGEKLLLRVAKDVRARCGGKLDAVVATHRHEDHIGGFATNRTGTAPGDVIASCKPDLVIQPWTEDPAAARDALKPTQTLAAGLAHIAGLRAMQGFASSAVEEARRQTQVGSAVPGRRTFLEDVEFQGLDAIKNESAVKNLARMGRRAGAKAAYVHFGSKSGLEPLLPGVKIQVLGPPTLEQTDIIRRQRERDEAEYWHLQPGGAPAAGSAAELRGPAGRQEIPERHQWIVRQALSVRAETLYQLVRALDNAMNNTSVILLFTVKGRTLLFPGDAQIENWSYALAKPEVRKKLAKVHLYKVGHHGSLNATPKSMWNLFQHRGPKGAARLTSILSTLGDKHGDSLSGTEVPRTTLKKELDAHSELLSTQDMRSKTALVKPIVLDLTAAKWTPESLKIHDAQPLLE
ncbi:MAG: MBL fold metallo-hydrolase [Planctomycetes bacterium]|nr:MBL fold metallo-hydrolase [Planctomycetota bacterium]